MSRLKKSRSMPDYGSKTKKLWQIFFDDDKENSSGPSTRRSSIMNTSGQHHGVLYQGLLEAESDSDEEFAQGATGTTPGPSRLPDELKFKGVKETVLFERSQTLPNGTSVQNYNKPYDAREWESIEIVPAPSRPVPQRLSQEGGARFIIRSESDLELAIPANKQKRRCCHCLPVKGSQSDTFEHYACIALAFVAMAAIYVAIVIAIVYGFK